MKKAAIITGVLLALAALWLIGTPTSSRDSAGRPPELASSVSPAARTPPPAAAPREAAEGNGVGDGPAPSAPAPEPATPATFREALARRLAAFRSSGPAPAELAAAGGAALAALSANRTVIESGCFRAGCLITLKLSDGEAAAVAASMEAHSAAAGAWPGPRQRLEPIPLKDGTAHVTWLLHAP